MTATKGWLTCGYLVLRRAVAGDVVSDQRPMARATWIVAHVGFLGPEKLLGVRQDVVSGAVAMLVVAEMAVLVRQSDPVRLGRPVVLCRRP